MKKNFYMVKNDLYCINIVLLIYASLFIIVVYPKDLSAAAFNGALKNITITDINGINNPPQGTFTYTRTGNTIYFDASGSSDQDGLIQEYKWDFGDNEIGSGVTTDHTYTDLENLSVTLTVVDEDDGISINQEPIVIKGCSDTSFLKIESHTGNRQLIANASNTFVGGRYTGPDFSLCKVSFLIRTWVGRPITDTRTYEVRVYSMSGDNLGALKGTSEGISGSTFDSEITFRDFVFNPSIDVKSGDAIVLTEQTQSVDSSSFVRAYYYDQANTSISFGTWHESKTKTFITTKLTPSIKLYRYE
jgi:PKD repeat protein